MYRDKHTLAETLRKYRRHILGPLFVEAADTIDELLDTVNEQKAQIIALTAQTEEVPCGDACEIKTPTHD